MGLEQTIFAHKIGIICGVGGFLAQTNRGRTSCGPHLNSTNWSLGAEQTGQVSGQTPKEPTDKI
jgi:hypothetical protein